MFRAQNSISPSLFPFRKGADPAKFQSPPANLPRPPLAPILIDSPSSSHVHRHFLGCPRETTRDRITLIKEGKGVACSLRKARVLTLIFSLFSLSHSLVLFISFVRRLRHQPLTTPPFNSSFLFRNTVLPLVLRFPRFPRDNSAPYNIYPRSARHTHRQFRPWSGASVRVSRHNSHASPSHRFGDRAILSSVTQDVLFVGGFKVETR